MRERILCAKLAFLKRISSPDNDSLSGHVFRTLLTPGVNSISLVKQCRYLELPYGTNFTNQVLSTRDECSIREMKENILKVDKRCTLFLAEDHQSLKFVTQVSSWTRVWDFGLDFSIDGTTATLSILRKTVFSDKAVSS